jgi:hypothetical protein
MSLNSVTSRPGSGIGYLILVSNVIYFQVQQDFGALLTLVSILLRNQYRQQIIHISWLWLSSKFQTTRSITRFLLCYLQVCKYVLFPVWGIILFGILISAVLTRCQSSTAALLCWIFGFQFFASMFCFFFFVSWEGLLAKGCFLLTYLRLPCVCLEARFCSRNSQVSRQPLWLSV